MRHENFNEQHFFSENTRGDAIDSHQEVYDNLDSGKERVISLILNALDTSTQRPKIVFVNGGAGAGKSYFSERITEELKHKGRKVIFIETDNYAEKMGMEIYMYEDLSRQKRAWESGESFEYFNTLTGKKELVDAGLDVTIIVGGIDATDKFGIDKPLTTVFITKSFIDRLATKGWRDHIANASYGDTVDQFMDEIANPHPDQDLLAHLYRAGKESNKNRFQI